MKKITPSKTKTIATAAPKIVEVPKQTVKVGDKVHFRQASNKHMQIWIENFQSRFGKGPYLITEMVQGTTEQFYRLQPCPDIAWTQDWFLQ